MKHILLVEDDPPIVVALTEFLTGEDFVTTSAATQKETEQLMFQSVYDLLLVDLALLEGNGFDVCTVAKQRGLPVIFLTASTDENSVVSGLDMGADDYIAKPFRPRELVSRIRSVLRRYSNSQTVELPGNVVVDLEKGTVRKNGEEVTLSALEFKLFSALLTHRGKLMTRGKLLEEIWDIDGDFVNDNTLTVYIKRLREKIEGDPQAPAIIKTVRGMGYRVD